MVALGYVDQLEINQEGPHDPLKLVRVHDFDPLLETLFEPGVIAETQPLAQEPHLFLGIEKTSALLLYKYLTEHPTKEVDVPPQGLVLRLKADPRREVRVLRLRCLRGSLADIHVR